MSLKRLCETQDCPTSPREAQTNPQRFPLVYQNGDDFVIGHSFTGLMGKEYHFVGETLVGYREDITDIQPAECGGRIESGTLVLQSGLFFSDPCTFDEETWQLYQGQEGLEGPARCDPAMFDAL